MNTLSLPVLSAERFMAQALLRGAVAAVVGMAWALAAGAGGAGAVAGGMASAVVPKAAARVLITQAARENLMRKTGSFCGLATMLAQLGVRGRNATQGLQLSPGVAGDCKTFRRNAGPCPAPG